MQGIFGQRTAGVGRHRNGGGFFVSVLMLLMLLPATGVAAQEDFAASEATPITEPVQPENPDDDTGDKGDEGTSFQAFASSFTGTITIEPAATTVAPGGSVTFTVTIAGTVSGISGSEALLTFETAWPFPAGVTSFQPGDSCDSDPAWDDDTGTNSDWWWLDAYCYTNSAGEINASFSVTGIVPMVTDVYSIDSTLYLGDYGTVLVPLTEYAVLTVEGDAPAAVSVSTAQSTVAPESSVTFTVSIDLSLGEQHTVYVEFVWPFTGVPTSAGNTDPPCATSSFNGPAGTNSYWYDVICTSDANGELQYSFDITGNVPDSNGTYPVTAKIYDGEFNGPVLREVETVASVTVDDSLVVPGNYSLSITPAEAEVSPGATVSFDVAASGTLTDGGGVAIPGGTIYLGIAWPFSNPSSATIPSGCSSLTSPHSEGMWLDLQCTVGDDGSFDYLYTVTGTAPATAGNYGVTAGLWQDEFFGRELIVMGEVTSFTVSVPPDPGGPTISIVQTPAGPVDPGDPVSFTVSYSGTIYTGGLSTSIATTWPWPIPEDGTLSGNCASPSTGTDNATFWSLTVMCPGPVDGGPFSFSYTLSGTAPDEPGNFTIGAVLDYYSDQQQSISHELNPQFFLTVAGADDTTPDPYVITVSPETRDAIPGEEVTYTVTFSGTLLDDDDRQPNHEIYLGTAFPFDYPEGATANTVAADTAGECSIGHSGYRDVNSWWFDVECTTDDNGDFDFTYTVTGIAPDDLGTYPVASTLYDHDPGLYLGTPVVATATYATLTVIEPQVGTYTIAASPTEKLATPGEAVSFDVSLSGTLIDGYGDPVANGHVALFTDWPFEPTVENLPPGCTNAPFGVLQLETICETSNLGEFDYTFTVTGTAPVNPSPSSIHGQLHLDTMYGETLTNYQTLAGLVVRGVVPGTELTISPPLVIIGQGEPALFSAHFVGVAAPGEELTLTVHRGSFGADPGTWSCVATTGSCTAPVAGAYQTVSSIVTANPESGAYDVRLDVGLNPPVWLTPGNLAEIRVVVTDASETELAVAYASIAMVADEPVDGLQVVIDPGAAQGLPGSTHTFLVNISGEDLGSGLQDVAVQIPQDLVSSATNVLCQANTGTCTVPESRWLFASGKAWVTTVEPDSNGDLDAVMAFTVTLPGDVAHGDSFVFLAAASPLAQNFSVATLTASIPGGADFFVTTFDALPVPDDTAICLSGNGLVDDLCLDLPAGGDPLEFTGLVPGDYDYVVQLPVNSGYYPASGSITVNPGETVQEVITLQPGIAVTLAPSSAAVAPGATVAFTVNLTLVSAISNSDLSLQLPGGFGFDTGSASLVCALPAECGAVAFEPASSVVTVHIVQAEAGTITLVAPVVVPDDAADDAYSLWATLSMPTSREFSSEQASLTVDHTLLPPTTGTVDLTLQTSDEGDIPDEAQVCIGAMCETVGSTGGADVQAASPSPVTITFADVAAGPQTVTVTGAAPYEDHSGTIDIAAGNTLNLEITLQLPDVAAPSPTIPGTDPTVTPTPGSDETPTVTPTPDGGAAPTSTATPGSGGEPTATSPAGGPGPVLTPTAADQSGAPTTPSPGSGVTQLPSTGTGSAGGGSWLLLLVGAGLIVMASAAFIRRAGRPGNGS